MTNHMSSSYADAVQHPDVGNTARHVLCIKTRNMTLLGPEYGSTCHKQLIDNR
jgi:hypothetical protein